MVSYRLSLDNSILDGSLSLPASPTSPNDLFCGISSSQPWQNHFSPHILDFCPLVSDKRKQ